MYRIYVDDMRLCPDGFDRHCYSVNETLNCIRKKYKEGIRQFFLDLDHDTPDELENIHGGSFMNILKNIEALRQLGRFKDIHIDIHIHTGNVVGRQNMQAFIQDHSDYMREVFG